MQTIMIVEDDPDIRDGVRIALDCNRVWVDEQEADLTETEYNILKLLMQSPHRIFPVQVIYETVWGEPYFYVSNGTVMVHIRNLRMKVEQMLRMSSIGIFVPSCMVIRRSKSSTFMTAPVAVTYAPPALRSSGLK